MFEVYANSPLPDKSGCLTCFGKFIHKGKTKILAVNEPIPTGQKFVQEFGSLKLVQTEDGDPRIIRSEYQLDPANPDLKSCAPRNNQEWQQFISSRGSCGDYFANDL